jgi:hypothetical protein
LAVAIFSAVADFANDADTGISERLPSRSSARDCCCDMTGDSEKSPPSHVASFGVFAVMHVAADAAISAHKLI